MTKFCVTTAFSNRVRSLISYSTLRWQKLEYEIIHSVSLAREAERAYINAKHKMISVRSAKCTQHTCGLQVTLEIMIKHLIILKK